MAFSVIDGEEEEDLFLFKTRVRPPFIDRVLERKGLRRIIRYQYTAGDCLFDSVTYVLRLYGEIFESVELRQKMVRFFRRQLLQKDPKAIQWKENFLSAENLQELHPELRIVDAEETEHEYLRRMKYSAREGGLWGDHFCAFWLQEYLERPILIWIAETGKTVGNEDDYSEDAIHLVYHSNYGGNLFPHYEPAISEDDFEALYDEPPPLRREENEDLMPLLIKAAEEHHPVEEINVESSESTQGECTKDEECNSDGLEQRQQEEEDMLPVAESLKRFSSESVDMMQKRIKVDPYQRKVQEAIERARTEESIERARPECSDANKELSPSKSEDMKVLEDDCGRLTNFEVLDLLRNKAASDTITKSESLVYGYLIQTPAATQTVECLKRLSKEPLIARLCSLERIQVANLRTDQVQLYLIVEEISKRFSEEEVDKISDIVHRVLPEPPEV